ncbi:enoyl-CoA hydratase-related protein [Saccharopolyspora gloriosae]|uniref:Enoyl-CoA hydratase/carnithine racemase n=1 Tax=Saccharopolyspora gloriosae TaxID=455344 RepID=A0A840NP80_9PSEU|nr:enoyl-CoA hydratase/carnithine racemase [Saccharopolyspora gloriosae]
MDYEEIRYEIDGPVATISLNRPQARNGYTVRMADELAAAFDRADRDEDVRVVVFTGEGKDFCVGADLSAGGFDVSEPGAEGQDDWKEPAGRCALRIFAMNKPVIAAIRGAAVGAGASITLACDYRLAAKDSRFGFVFSRRGIYPEGASTWFLPRLVGLGTALDWMISGRLFDAAEARDAGLVHAAHEPDQVLDEAYSLARDLAANTAPVSIAVIRQMLYRLSALESPYDVQRVDSRLIAGLPTNEDAAEGVMSFLERRPPRFPGTVAKDLPGFLPWLDDGTAPRSA